MPICLHRYTFLQCYLFLFFDEPSSSQISSVLTKLFLCLLLNFTHGNNHGFFYFWGSKTLAEHYILTVQWLLLSSSFLFFFPFFFFQKKFPRSSHCWKETFAWNYLEHWCEFNIWQNVMVEASTMVIWCCESVMFLFFLKIKIALAWTAKIAHGSQNRAVGLWFVWVPAFFAWSGFWC